MSSQEPFEISQDLKVLPPKSGTAYPIPSDEWADLKGKVSNITFDPWLFQNLGFLLLGVAISTFITILLGTFSDPSKEVSRVIAWAVTSVSTLGGTLCLVFAGKERQLHRDRATDVVSQMDLIEKRFSPPKA